MELKDTRFLDFILNRFNCPKVDNIYYYFNDGNLYFYKLLLVEKDDSPIPYHSYFYLGSIRCI